MLKTDHQRIVTDLNRQHKRALQVQQHALNETQFVVDGYALALNKFDAYVKYVDECIASEVMPRSFYGDWENHQI